jgi:glycosyltransferase involved in cell wall biosynthesis
VALNLPVVIWNFPGAYDLLMNGEAGKVCRTVNELNETINSLISSTDLRIQNGIKGHLAFSHTYSYEKFAQTIKKIYFRNE